MSEQESNAVEQVEQWAARLHQMAVAAFLADTPGGNLQLVSAALCVAAGGILQAHCPAENQPEGACILVDFLLRGILIEGPAPVGAELSEPKILLN